MPIPSLRELRWVSQNILTYYHCLTHQLSVGTVRSSCSLYCKRPRDKKKKNCLENTCALHHTTTRWQKEPMAENWRISCHCCLMMLLPGYRVEWMLQSYGWGVTTAACFMKSWGVFLECLMILCHRWTYMNRTSGCTWTIDQPNYCCCD